MNPAELSLEITKRRCGAVYPVTNISLCFADWVSLLNSIPKLCQDKDFVKRAYSTYMGVPIIEGRNQVLLWFNCPHCGTTDYPSCGIFDILICSKCGAEVY